jgi:hypothetical protein
MKNRWVLLVVFGAFACQSKSNDGVTASASAQGSTAPTVALAKVAADGTCQSNLDYLVPLQKYGESDLIRAIAIDA